MSNLERINAMANQATFSCSHTVEKPSHRKKRADINFVVTLKHSKSCSIQIHPILKA